MKIKRFKDIGLGMWQWGIDNNEPNIGKYVILNEYTLSKEMSKDTLIELDNFVKNNIGKIIYASKSGYGIHYCVRYENIPNMLSEYFSQSVEDLTPRYLICTKENIIAISENYKDLEHIISANKYNL